MDKKRIANILIQAFQKGNKLLIAGNGGSAAMSSHFAAELVGRFEKERIALPAIALTTDTSILTAWSNDYHFYDVFRRQIEALGQKDDVFITLSTSGRSSNLLDAMEYAKKKGLIVIDFPRKDSSTAKIQEYQLKLMHDIVRIVEKAFL